MTTPININMLGIADGDSIIFNYKTKSFGQIQIPFKDNNNPNLPNFIIALSGQSNAEGYRSEYDKNNPNDQPHNRIFGWNPVLEQWQIADLRTESLGWSYETFKQLGTQCSSFHFARRLVEAYPNIRPGIIHVGVSGASIAFWTNWKPTDKYYALTQTKLNWYNGHNTFPDYKTRNQGYIFDVHMSQIKLALQKLPIINQYVNVVCWDQGESDPELDYLKESLKQVIDRYQSALNNKYLGFIAVSTTGMLYLNTNIKVNDVLEQLNEDSYPNTKFVIATDLPVAIQAGTTNTPDIYHFNSVSQRIIGTRCFQAYRSIFI
jgi:hypothetical protein